MIQIIYTCPIFKCLRINEPLSIPFEWDGLIDKNNVIGTGKYGQVHVYRRTDGTHYVVKTQCVHKYLKREVQCLRMCVHPCIVQFLAHRIVNEESQLAMCQCPGVELYEYIVNYDDDIPLLTIQHIMRQLLDTIHYLHDMNIMHRDIKPENIMFDSQTNHIYLIDFGFARKFNHKHSIQKTCVGTAYYTAYEIVRNRQYTCKIDEWAAGVILFILLYKYPPFYGDSNDDIYQRILKKQIPFPTDIRSNEGYHCIICLLQCNPTIRYSAEQCLKLAWFTHPRDPTMTHVL